MNYSHDNEDLRRNDMYMIRQNIYAIGNGRAQIQQHGEQEMRHQTRQTHSRTIHAVPNPKLKIGYEQEMKALLFIFKTWRRGNSLISNLEDKTCSI